MAGWRRTTSPLSTLAERRQMEMTSPFAYAHLFSSLPTLKIRQNPPILVRKRGDTPAPPHPASPKSDKISPFLSDSKEGTPQRQHRQTATLPTPKIRQNPPVLVRKQGNTPAPPHPTSPESDKISPFLSDSKEGIARTPEVAGRRGTCSAHSRPFGQAYGLTRSTPPSQPLLSVDRWR